MFTTKGIKKIESSYGTTYVLKENGDLFVTGNNDYGMLGLGMGACSYYNILRFSRITDINELDIKNIGYTSDTDICVYVLKNDGTVLIRGANRNSRFGIQNGLSFYDDFVQLPITDVKSICVNYNNIYVLKNDGTVWVSGSQFSSYGLGLSNGATYVSVFTQLEAITDVKKIYVDDQGSKYFLKNDGTIWGCGNNFTGQLGIGNTDTQLNIVQANISDVRDIFVGSREIIALKNDGTAWGAGNGTKLGINSSKLRNSTYKQVVSIDSNEVKDIQISGGASYLLKNDGTVWVTGWNIYGALGSSQYSNKQEQLTFVQMNITDVKEIKTDAMQYSVLFLKNNGELFGLGENKNGELGNGECNVAITEPVKIMDNCDSILFSGCKISVISKNGEYYACGDNLNFRLKLPIQNKINQFTKVPLNDIKDIVVKGHSVVVLKNDGTVWFAGLDIYFIDPSGSRMNIDTFTQINITDVKKIVVSSSEIFMLKNDGTVWFIGDNYYGSAGVGNNKSNLGGVVYSNIDNVYDISSYIHMVFAIKNDGTVWTCGKDTYLTSIKSNVFVELTTVNNIDKIVTGGNPFAYAITKDGSLMCGGDNYYGQLGLGAASEDLCELFVDSGLTNVKKVILCTWSTLVITNDGKLYGAGRTHKGTLGVIDSNYYVNFTDLGLENVVDAVVSYDDVIVILENGDVYITGEFNEYSAIVGETSSRINGFKKIENVSNIKHAAIGKYNDDRQYFLYGDEDLYVFGCNNGGELGIHQLQSDNATKVLQPIKVMSYPDLLSSGVVNDHISIDGEEVKIKDIDIGEHEIIVADDCIYVKGDNSKGQLGLEEKKYYNEYIKIELSDVRYAKCLKNLTVIKRNGKLFVAGANKWNGFNEYEF